MATCFSYARFSSKKQEQGDSLRRQLAMCKAWMDRHPEHILDTSIRLRDLGKSAFDGTNLDPEKGDLGKFIALAKSNDSRIPEGSILIIENLDRFTRLPPRKALSHFSEVVVDCGITIQVLSPEQTIDASNIDNIEVGLPMFIAAQIAHAETEKKSQRVKAYWKEVRDNGKYDSGPIPSWLYIKDDGDFGVRPEGKKALKFIFEQTIQGTGQVTIVKELNKRFKPIGRSGSWNNAFVTKVLNERAVCGEFQFYRFDENKKRVPTGDIIPDFYKRVISDSIWHQARASATSRAKRKGRRANDFINLFVGLVKMPDGFPAHIQNVRSKRTKGNLHIQRRWQSWGHRKGMEGACPYSYDYWKFEQFVLSALHQLKPEDLLPSTNKKDNSLQRKQAELTSVSRRIEEIEEAIGDMRNNTAIAKMGQQLDRFADQREEIQKEICRLNTAKTSEKTKPLEETKDLLEILATTNDMSLKLKLRSLIAVLVKEIILEPIKCPNRKVEAKITVNFNNHSYRIVIDTTKLDHGQPMIRYDNIGELETIRRAKMKNVNRKSLGTK